MSIINTILGPVDASDLGFTLMHEHIRESSAGVPYTFPDLFDHEEDVARGWLLSTRPPPRGLAPL